MNYFLLLLLGVIISSNALANNYTKYFEPAKYPASYQPVFEPLKPNQQIEIVHLSTNDIQLRQWIEKGYSVIGTSQFSDRKLPDNLAIAQAKKVGASLVVIDTLATSNNSYTSDDDLNNLDVAYQYAVFFLAIDNSWKKPNTIGIRMGEIPLDRKSIYQRNTGVYVSEIIKNSRAYYANIINGDVIIGINNIPVYEPEQFNQLKEQELLKAKTITFTILRPVNGDLREIQIPVNFN